jgi:hypothetical protein
MTREEIFDAWAPPSAIWSAWVKPVMFSQVRRAIPQTEIVPPNMNWTGAADGKTGMVLDLPGADAVGAALPLALMGYRPVPLYNGCPSPLGKAALVDVDAILAGLVAGVSHLLQVRLPENAPPVFLLDHNRRTAGCPALPGAFDNRSISLPTDFPSGNLMLSRGIRRIILVQATAQLPQADLSHTLRRWQEAGIQILAKDLDNAAEPYPIEVKRPGNFKTLWYNVLATLGLRSSPLGGFGGMLPVPSAG